MEQVQHHNNYQGPRRKKKSSGKVYREVYHPERIERLKSIIADFQRQGSQKFYSVLVDGETVVPKNYNAQNFDNYKKYLLSNTQHIEVRMYFGHSPSCNRHVFQTAQAPLGGIRQEDVDEQIQKALAKQKAENELAHLKKELEKKDKKLKEMKGLEAELEALKKKLELTSLLEKGMGMVQSFQSGTTPALQGTPEQETEVEVEVSQPETKADQFYQQLISDFGEEKAIKAIKTWQIFTKYPELKNEFIAIVNQKIKKNGKTQVHHQHQRKQDRGNRQN